MVSTHNQIKQLRTAYKQALADEQPTFIFEGKTILVAFAKYLLEYLDSITKKL